MINGMRSSALYPHLSFGNTKLPKSTAIFNLGPAKTCPSRALGLCQAFIEDKCVCYARKAEWLYPNVLPHREKQALHWQSTTAERFVKDFLYINNQKTKKLKSLRINESGDFADQKDLNKANRIAKLLKKHGITVYCYTARKDLNFRRIKDLVVMGSGFKKSGIKGEFKMVTSLSAIPKGYGVCKGDCRVCNRCLKGKDTVILKH